MCVHVTWMGLAALAHEIQQRALSLGCRDPTGGGGTRVHLRMKRARDESIVDEDVFLDPERRVFPFEIARSVTPDAMAERQILCARRCANRIGLHESQRVDRALQSRGREEAASDGRSSQVINRDAGYGSNSLTGRTSIVPSRAGGIFAASRNASSSLSASMR